jgi:DNA-directed RNA polymerase subunit M
MVGGKRTMACSCGYSPAGSGSSEIRLGGSKDDRKLEVVSDEGPALPIVDAKCKKCGHGKAYYWEQQTRAADEPATRFYRCTSCKATWREYK